MAAELYARIVKDDEFVARVRRHRPSALIPIVAACGAQYSEPGSWMSSPYGKLTPWALAEIARVSLAFGNEHRNDATERDVIECAAAYVAIGDPELSRRAPETLAFVMMRMASEQLSFQRTVFNQIARTVAIYDQTTPGRTPRVLQSGWEHDLLGCSIVEFAAIGVLLRTGAVKNSGRFNLAWLDQPQFQQVTDEIPAAVIRNTITREFVADTDSFQSRRPSIRLPSPEYRRYTYNPLLGRPVVSGIADDFLVPVPGQIVRKVSPLGIYYSGMTKWGSAFAEDAGDLFEQYVGRQLQTLKSAVVYPEIVYGHDNRKSVDWIVVLEQAVLLIEVKSVRPTESVRLGTPESVKELSRMLGRAYQQVETTDHLLAEGHPEFAHIPQDRPRIGLVVTVEPFHTANTPFTRHLYRETLSLPALLCSSEDLERLVTLKDSGVDEYLLDLVNDPTRDGWQVSSGLVGKSLARNEVLDRAWKTLPWRRDERDDQ
ncbi:hypothetical protein [Rhodococcus qingshengii]|uniref:hypothetical protein n=1 Tax=Rhodococcus qingshengii TaxID=334542 RepID=UPI0012E71697|nr:hypothetical protein [Rhodococcus qingshengii]